MRITLVRVVPTIIAIIAHVAAEDTTSIEARKLIFTAWRWKHNVNCNIRHNGKPLQQNAVDLHADTCIRILTDRYVKRSHRKYIIVNQTTDPLFSLTVWGWRITNKYLDLFGVFSDDENLVMDYVRAYFHQFEMWRRNQCHCCGPRLWNWCQNGRLLSALQNHHTHSRKQSDCGKQMHFIHIIQSKRNI